MKTKPSTHAAFGDQPATVSTALWRRPSFHCSIPAIGSSLRIWVPTPWAPPPASTACQSQNAITSCMRLSGQSFYILNEFLMFKIYLMVTFQYFYKHRSNDILKFGSSNIFVLFVAGPSYRTPATTHHLPTPLTTCRPWRRGLTTRTTMSLPFRNSTTTTRQLMSDTST